MAYFRSTENFSLYLSDSSNVFDRLIVSDTLTDARNVACSEIPLESFYFPEVQGRYVKFEVNSYHDKGGGLKYISFMAKGEHKNKSCINGTVP